MKPAARHNDKGAASPCSSAGWKVLRGMLPTEERLETSGQRVWHFDPVARR